MNFFEETKITLYLKKRYLYFFMVLLPSAYLQANKFWPPCPTSHFIKVSISTSTLRRAVFASNVNARIFTKFLLTGNSYLVDRCPPSVIIRTADPSSINHKESLMNESLHYCYKNKAKVVYSVSCRDKKSGRDGTRSAFCA